MKLLLLLPIAVALPQLARACDEQQLATVQQCYDSFAQSYNFSKLPVDYSVFLLKLKQVANEDHSCFFIQQLKNCLARVSECATPLELSQTLGLSESTAKAYFGYLKGMSVMCPYRRVLQKSNCGSSKEFVSAFGVCLKNVDSTADSICLPLKSVGPCIFDWMVKKQCSIADAALWCRIGHAQAFSTNPQCPDSRPVCQRE